MRTVQAKTDADLLIVLSAVECSNIWVIIVIGDSTDLLVLLLHHCIPEYHKVYLQSEPKVTTSGVIWDIEAIVKKIWTETSKLLLCAHAILGCKTTSCLYILCKGIALKRLSDN